MARLGIQTTQLRTYTITYRKTMSYMPSKDDQVVEVLVVAVAIETDVVPGENVEMNHECLNGSQNKDIQRAVLDHISARRSRAGERDQGDEGGGDD